MMLMRRIAGGSRGLGCDEFIARVCFCICDLACGGEIRCAVPVVARASRSRDLRPRSSVRAWRLVRASAVARGAWRV